MKLSNMGIIFVVIILPFFVLDDIRTRDLTAISTKQTEYNLAIDNAIEAALFECIESDDGKNAAFNKREVVERFFSCLYCNFGIMENAAAKRYCNLYVPVICLVEENGCYFRYYKLKQNENGDKVYEAEFSDKILFESTIEHFIVYFTLTDYLYVKDCTTKEYIEGKYLDLQKEMPTLLKWNQDEFEELRKGVIIQTLVENITFFINQHNKIAKQFHIHYEFHLPVIEKEDWYRTVNSIGMLVLFQGYPYGAGDIGKYNRMAFGGARLKKEP
ncbi:hypothetical protein [Anaeromicropila populeti]|uniref:Uncharacterized protein n=1 Tax=Anaeromicropila populeti TaxID=37658 RepID=A0A1I6JDG0_9FIRM|nr:hypothetical protein [Anaeromicropila populeti]SFR77006.1 hypothetical protein SAMN05661086_01589 [Anaeromicropila populeti]